MRQRILFVDDEPQLLSGLRRMLWDKREVWEMHFAGSGPEALAVLEELPVDVVVSDARMPGMDGPQFLETVRQRWPGTARLILSGHSDRDFVLRSIRPAHQFLSKPCPPEELKSTIGRVLRLGDLFRDERLRPAIARIDTLPVLPSVFTELTDALRSPNVSVKTMGAIIARDIGLATGILKLVNSSFFGLPMRVSSTEQAVTLLGVETLRLLVLSQALFSGSMRSAFRIFPWTASGGTAWARPGAPRPWPVWRGPTRPTRMSASWPGSCTTWANSCWPSFSPRTTSGCSP